MRFTVKIKIVAGLAVITLIGILSMLFIYRVLKTVESDVHELSNVQEPLILAAYEMEINMNGIGLAVLKYLSTRRPHYRSLAEKDIIDYEEFRAEYRQLIASDKERSLDALMSDYFQEFERLGRTLMEEANEQEVLFTQVTEHIEKIDEVIHNEIQPAIAGVRELTESRLKKAIASANLESEAAEIGFWAANYQRRQTPEARAKIDEKVGYFQKVLTEFESYDLTREEREDAQTLRRLFGQITIGLGKVVTLEDTINFQRDRFIELRLAMDDMLDDQIQPLARQHLEVPLTEAVKAAETAVNILRILVPLYILGAIVIGALLVIFITRPLRRLTKGAEAVGQGDFAYRIPETGADEFSDLAREFNRMVKDLRSTTVSRDLLEESESKLRDSVAELRREIGERERAEGERSKLSEALRRRENMAAMGSLVAGVAHEVRNPLFGISSSLDAMEARFVDRDELKRYLDVLRGQTQRLSSLMENLLDYGKPFVAEFNPAPIVRVIRAAIEGCLAIARHSQVGIAFDEPDRDYPVLMDEKRLPLVFQNLLENAIQHTPAGGAVRVEAAEEEDGKWVAIKVSDSGPGFGSQDVAQVFAPFFTRRKGGTGLGLSIAQRIVEHHGGEISAANSGEGGGVMTVRLPLAGSAARERKTRRV